MPKFLNMRTDTEHSSGTENERGLFTPQHRKCCVQNDRGVDCVWLASAKHKERTVLHTQDCSGVINSIARKQSRMHTSQTWLKKSVRKTWKVNTHPYFSKNFHNPIFSKHQKGFNKTNKIASTSWYASNWSAWAQGHDFYNETQKSFWHFVENLTFCPRVQLPKHWYIKIQGIVRNLIFVSYIQMPKIEHKTWKDYHLRASFLTHFIQIIFKTRRNSS